MYVEIREKIINVPITTVILSHDPEDPNGFRLHMFFCPNCGTPLGQYKGFIYSMMPGAIPMGLPWIQRCGTCKRKYAINCII